MADFANAVVYYVVFLLSTTLHEAAHAWAALRGGDLTAYHGGQVSLNPIPHIKREPIGMVVLPLVTVFITGWPFGFASAPYSIDWARRYPTRAAWMALAGPASNLLLVLLAGLAIRAGVMAGIVSAPQSLSFGEIAEASSTGLWTGAYHFIGVLFSLNLVLGIFNLLPVPPLDGSGALPLFLSPAATRRYQEFIWGTPGLSFLGIFVAWKLIDGVFQPLWVAAIQLLYPGVSYH
ncbi:MAG: site-2 protease family protein [Gemmatimonadales bacterium]